MLESRKHDDPTAGSCKRNKLGADDDDDELTRSSKKNKTISDGGGETTNELLISGDDFHPGSNRCSSIWSKLSKQVASNLSRSVVSLALPDGQEFACSGIAIKRVGDVTRFLTSANLARALIDDKRLDHDNVKVEVRLGRDVVTGFLGEYDLEHEIAYVNVMSALDVHLVPLNRVALAPDCKVLALGHGMSGDVHVMSTDGVLTGDSSGELKVSTCKISKVYEGGPLFDFSGNFLGMNFFRDTERTFFLPTRMVRHWLVRIECLRGGYRVLPNFFKAVSVGQRRRGRNSNSNQTVHRDVPPKDQFEDLGYPKPSISMLNDGMILINTFEEPFGDEYGNGVWSELSGAVSSSIQENTVALASFNGEIRFSACTGFFIKFNGCSTVLTSASLVRTSGSVEDKIKENLRIEVLLPTNQSVEGTLQHYNLHYNIALVSVKDFCPSHPAEIQHLWNDSGDVVSVGYCFKSGKLMAGRGTLFGRPNLLDCKYLWYSTCKITKAGIGGPLLSFDGRFLGMNFYGEVQGTPHLHWRVILCVLEHFKTEGSSVAKVDHAGKPSHLPDWTMAGDRSVSLNRWFVPKPYWRHPDDPKICTEPFCI